ncbi:MAG TPA: alpha/beta fold hydrolase [Candidatus Cybelea sp.]|nr:alpha/beta fold hydrolase [Candidatus Cybelea sp.]
MIRMVLYVIAGLIVAIGATLTGMIELGDHSPPPPMNSVDNLPPGFDISGLPELQRVPARDGTALAYRAYPVEGANAFAVLVHGSTANGAEMHMVAKALQASGVAAFAIDMRGHGATGRRGDVDYIGQLDDDVVDFVKAVGPKYPGAKRILIGHSSGGGFVLRFAGGPNGDLFDGYVPLSPYLAFDAPTARAPGANSDTWARPFVPRIIALSVLNGLGIPWFQGLPVVAFAVDPAHAANRTVTYSFRLAASFQPHRDYLSDVRAITRPTVLLIGANDELFRADQYAPLLERVQPKLKVEIVPNVTHMGIVGAASALDAVTGAVRQIAGGKS